MFRLLKLALYVFVGYKLYEYLQGMNLSGSGMQSQGGGSRQRQGGQRRGMDAPSHPQNMTGPARGGRRVEVDLGADTGGHTELVGRGVVRR